MSRYRLVQKLSQLKKIFSKLNFRKLITSFGLSQIFREISPTGQCIESCRIYNIFCIMARYSAWVYSSSTGFLDHTQTLHTR